MANAHRRRNWIIRIKVGEFWVKEELQERTFHNFRIEFTNMRGRPWNWFTANGVYRALLMMGRGNAIGSNSFTMVFFRPFYWEVVKEDMMRFFLMNFMRQIAL